MKRIKITLEVNVPDDFEIGQGTVHEEELMLDDALADAIYKAGYELFDSKPYEEII